MGLQLVMPAQVGNVIVDTRVSPIRDIAYFWPLAAAECLSNLDDSALWPKDLAAWLKQEGVTTEQLLEAAQAFVNAMQAATHPSYKHPVHALKAHGFFDCSPAARAAVTYRIGMYSTGAWWEGIREATNVADSPIGFGELAKAGDAIQRHLAKSRFRRWFDKVTFGVFS